MFPRLSAILFGFGIAACGAAGQAPSEAVELIFLDVGQGDATVIRSPEGNVALIDAGNDAEVVPLLQQLDITAIDLVVASHLDFDHIGGIDEVLRTFPVSYYMDNGQSHNSAEFRWLMRLLQQSDISYVAPVAQTIELASVTLRVLPPPGWARSSNDESIGIVVEYGDFRALLTGDSEVDELNYFLELGVPDVTVLKAAHHGARNGVTPRWVDVTRPEVVVISCGRNNAYGHPDPWALRYYEAVASEVYRTDTHGHIGLVGYADGSYEVAMQGAAAVSPP